MKVNISSLEDLSSILNSIKNTAVKNIQIIIIDSSIVPYLDHFIDCCNDLNCNVKVNKQLLVELNILENFNDRVQIN